MAFFFDFDSRVSCRLVEKPPPCLLFNDVELILVPLLRLLMLEWTEWAWVLLTLLCILLRFFIYALFIEC